MKLRSPKLLQGRIPCTEEEFVSRHFASGGRRDAARRLWHFLESQMALDLSGDFATLITDGGAYDSLDAVELAMALEDLGGLDAEADGLDEPIGQSLGTFREIVRRMTRHVPRPR